MSADYQVLQAAANWFAVLQSANVTERERQAWGRWMSEPAHARAWQRVEQISGRIQPLAHDAFGASATALLQPRSPNRRQALKTLSILLAGGAMTGAGSALPWRSLTADRRTAVGQVAEWRLADGSLLWLNTNSAVDISFDAHLRQLSLYRGELMIQARPERRPLWLRSADGSLGVEAGARLSLRQLDGHSQLCVFDGAVEVRPDKAAARTVASGLQLDFDSRHIGPARPVQPQRNAWVRGVLLADKMPLGRFVNELSRYRQGYLGCDPRIAGLQVVGAFPLADTDRVLDVLADTLSLRVNRRLPWWVSLEPA